MCSVGEAPGMSLGTPGVVLMSLWNEISFICALCR